MDKDIHPMSPQKTSKSQQSLHALFSLFVLTVGLSGVIAGVWVAIALMVDPDALIWMNQYLPELNHLAETNRTSLQTLEEVRAKLERSGSRAGYPLQMQIGPYEDIILPVFARQPGCDAESVPPVPCESIRQLRVYRRAVDPEPFKRDQPIYRLISQVQIDSPTEASVIAPLQLEDGISNRHFPLTTLKWGNSALVNDRSQRWVHLTGEMVRAGQTIRYGQTIYYNANTTYIGSLLSWTSPANELPVWSKSGGNSSQMLLTVNQTSGLEPKFKAYQLQTNDFLPAPFELKAISLGLPVLQVPEYQEGLKLAKGGLWTKAQQRLQPLRKSAQWSDDAQGQLELISRHAQWSQDTVNRDRESMGEEVLAQLLDGRWDDALAVYQSAADRSEIDRLLADDRGVLWQRIRTAIADNPQDEGALVWGALLRASQDGPQGAIAWLEQQDSTVEWESLLTAHSSAPASTENAVELISE
ncbi:hypothetical protein [Roseofilum casamattae]|uniref:Tetratricopeptide repeat protein n=1 Tax=Roseofilum casamattae BLCC-M143 TaxID=3022442 RepID=A0ABT7BYE7_9CYAN|nr:hypothetical protein [Roseofilum casamattae]MDJ1183308.1 hypothetical protein [Roseofilum casamattae BLCC-M143]